ncbi:glycosyltransferase [Arthrobacter sp. CAN_A214]|uniref:glycosyltransferase n=1 Tax=Arthrobacter sp. CAN_A214 TaxID=2787720 RepID=UPI002FF1F56F
MRRLGTATISYTYKDRDKARRDLRKQPVYVAPNSIYRAAEIGPAGLANNLARDTALYVGRLEGAKKPQLMIEALSITKTTHPSVRVRIVGSGSEEASLRRLAKTLDVDHKVEFAGWIDEPSLLREMYAQAFCSLSPGFAGLGLTQSLGYGVPMLVARNEPHSPEIELAETGGVHWFESDSPTSLAHALGQAWSDRGGVPHKTVSDDIKQRYSAEAMGAGLINAISTTMKKESRRVTADDRSVIPAPLRGLARTVLRGLAVRGPVSYGESFRVGMGARVRATHCLTIGDRVAVGPRSVIQVNGSIGNFVMIGMNVQIVGKNDHAYDQAGAPMIESTWIGDRTLSPADEITIEDDVWIGASSVVLSGIQVGEGSIIAAGAVVTKSIPPYSIVAGNPARLIAKRFADPAAEQFHAEVLRRTRLPSED